MLLDLWKVEETLDKLIKKASDHMGVSFPKIGKTPKWMVYNGKPY